MGQGSPAWLVSLAQLGGAAFIGQLPAFHVWVLDRFGNPLSGVVMRLELVPILTVGLAGFGAGSVVQAMAVNSVATFGRVAIRTLGRYELPAFAGLVGALSNPLTWR